MKTQATKQDVYSRVTNRIVADLEKGVRPWLKPWTSRKGDGQVSRPVRHDGLAYNGINVVLLWCDAMEKGFDRSMWMTYKQAEAVGAHVRKGETGSTVVYADRFSKLERDEKGEETCREFRS